MKGSGEWEILVVNPGGTSTKVALYVGEREALKEEIVHDSSELASFTGSGEQGDWRLAAVRRALGERGVRLPEVDAVAGRGGPVAPVPAGVFLVEAEMLAAIAEGRVMLDHASLLGAPMAYSLALEAGCSAFVVDPVSVDELSDEARMTGLPGLEKRALSHALSVNAAAREAAARLGKPERELNLVVLHLGSGFTAAAKRRGRLVDAESLALMAPIRSGALPMFELVDLCFSGRYDAKAIRRLMVGKGGWTALLGTHDLREVYRRIDAGDDSARLVLGATLYGLSKHTAAMAAALGGPPDAIVVTGGLARSERLIDELTRAVSWLSKEIIVIPGGDEMRALAEGVLGVLEGRERARSMTPYLK